MCYRDTTFCRGDGCTKFETCPRALTEEVQGRAEKWWGGKDAPIAEFTEPKKLVCWDDGKEEG